MVLQIIKNTGGYSLLSTTDKFYRLSARYNLPTFFLKITDLTNTIKDFAEAIDLQFFFNKKKQIIVLKEKPEKFLKGFLLSNQVLHAKKLIQALKKYNSAIDISQAGAGKTYTAVAAAKVLEKKIIVITTLTNSNKWKEVSAIAKVQNHVTTYESLRSKNNQFISQNDFYRWNIDPQKFLIIYDEAHKTINKETINQKILLAAIIQKIPVLFLSASLADNPFEFRAIGFALRIYKNIGEYNLWLQNHQALPENQNTKNWKIPLSEKRKEMQRIRRFLFNTGRASEIPVSYQVKNNIIPVLIKKQKQNLQIQEAIEAIKLEATEEKPFVKILRERQISELQKIKYIYNEARKDIAKGFYVIVFLNFIETIYFLAEMFSTNSYLIGSMSKTERNFVIRNFQNGSSKILICSDAGIEGIDLDDKTGQNPRITYISPKWSGKKFKQIIGRAVRTTTKSNTTQKIVFIDNSIEKKVYKKMNERIEVLKTLNEKEWDYILFEEKE